MESALRTMNALPGESSTPSSSIRPVPRNVKVEREAWRFLSCTRAGWRPRAEWQGEEVLRGRFGWRLGAPREVQHR
jgi:hypothetical protein